MNWRALAIVSMAALLLAACEPSEPPHQGGHTDEEFFKACATHFSQDQCEFLRFGVSGRSAKQN